MLVNATRLAGAVLAILTLIAPTRAEVIHVPRDYPTLGAALDAAAHGDEVVLADGVWTGEGNLELELKRKALTIRSENGPRHCVIDGGGEADWLRIDGHGTDGSVIEGLTIRGTGRSGLVLASTRSEIRNCVFTKSEAPAVVFFDVRGLVTDSTFEGVTEVDRESTDHGAIYGVDVDLTIRSCRFISNLTEGATLYGRQALVEDCTFQGNQTNRSGAGLALRVEAVAVRRCEFVENAGSDGAAIFLERSSARTAQIEHCSFSGNRSSGLPYPYTVVVEADETLLADCDFSGNNGYGMVVRGDELHAARCTFTGNTGGGLVAGVVERASISDITAIKNGRAGLVVGATEYAKVSDSVFRGNGPGEYGSGVRTASDNVVLERCIIEGNRAEDGGGVRGNTELRDCIVRGNHASYRGGGVFGDRIRIINSVIADNTAVGNGGGVYAESVAAAGSQIIGNVSQAGAGGIDTLHELVATNCVVAGNFAGQWSGGGVFVTSGTATLSNCILWHNTAPRGAQLGVGLTASLVAAFNNVEGGRKGVWRPENQVNFTWKRSNIDADPLFVNPDAGDYRLQAGSPCIDAADNRAVPEFVAADPDRHFRFHDDPNTPDTGRGRGAIVDMGAFEFDAPASCIGEERLRARCVPIDDGFAIKAILDDGRADARLTLESDTNPTEPQVIHLNGRGRGKALFQADDPQSVRVRALECNLVAETKCR